MAPGRQQDRAVFGKQDVHVLGIRDVENEKMPWGEEAEIDLGDRAFEPNGDGKCLGRAPLLSAGMAKTSDRKPDEHEPAKHWHGNLQSLSQPRAWLPTDLRFCCGGLRRPPPSPQTYPARGRRAQAPVSSKRGLGSWRLRVPAFAMVAFKPVRYERWQAEGISDGGDALSGSVGQPQTGRFSGELRQFDVFRDRHL